ncbi:Blue-light-activated protein [compost metagenome]
MIYGFAKQSGGQVRIKSEEGVSPRVYLQLPTHKAEIDVVTRLKPLAESAVASSGETVLVVDDQPSVRIFVSEALGSCGYIVIEAADSQCRPPVTPVRYPHRCACDRHWPPGGNRRQADGQYRAFSRPGLPVLFMTG